MGASVARGSVAAATARHLGTHVVHVFDLPEDGDGRLRLPDGPVPSGLVAVEAGDVLIARIHRSLHRRVALVVSSRMPITDAVLRVRLPERVVAGTFAAVRSDEGAARLLAAPDAGRRRR